MSVSNLVSYQLFSMRFKDSKQNSVYSGSPYIVSASLKGILTLSFSLTPDKLLKSNKSGILVNCGLERTEYNMCVNMSEGEIKLCSSCKVQTEKLWFIF